MYREGKLVKIFRGMAGLGANVAKAQRTGTIEPGAATFNAEGVEGYIPYAGVQNPLIIFSLSRWSWNSIARVFSLV